MKKNKERLFEMMHKVTGMPLNEWKSEGMGINNYVKEILLNNINRITNTVYEKYNKPRIELTIDYLKIPHNFMTNETRNLLQYILNVVIRDSFEFLSALKNENYVDNKSRPGFVDSKLNPDTEFEIKEELKILIKGKIKFETDTSKILTKEELDAAKKMFKIFIGDHIKYLDFENFKKNFIHDDFFMGIQRRILTDLSNN